MDHYGLSGKDLAELRRDQEAEERGRLNYTVLKNARQIMAALHVDADTATTALAILFGDKEPEEIEATAEWVRQCYNTPNAVDVTLHAVNAVLGLHGLEYVDAHDGRALRYLNPGDLDTVTIVDDPSQDEWILCNAEQLLENEETAKEEADAEEIRQSIYDQDPWFPGMPPSV